MNKCLIIEDDEFKENSLTDFIKNRYRKVSVEVARSLLEATEALSREEFQLILVDMAIPSHPVVSGKGVPQSLLTGGLEVLMELNFSEAKIPAIIVSQYPDIEITGSFYTLKDSVEVLKRDFYFNILSCVNYVEGDDMWKQQLTKVLDKYENINS